jgi:hypothetical protein
LLVVHDSPTVANGLDRLARLLRHQLVELFTDELAERPAEVLDAIDICLSWDAWDRLRSKQRLSVVAARRILASTVLAVITRKGVQSE